jgi:hypothetical protein
MRGFLRCALLLSLLLPGLALSQTLSITLAWDTSSGSDPTVGFRIYRQNGCTGSFTQLGGTLALLPQTYTDSGLAPVGSYCWRVTAVGASTNESAPSNTYRWDAAPNAGTLAMVQDAPPRVPFGLLNTTALIRRDLSALRGLLGWWRVTVPLDGGPRLWDLAAHGWGQLTNFTTAGWRPTTRPGGEGEIRLGGTTAQGGNAEHVEMSTRIGVPGTAFTAMLWVKGVQHQDVDLMGQEFNGTNDVWGINWQPADNKLHCYVGTYNVAASTTLTTFSATDWTHVACTYDGGTILLYVNGVPQNATSYSGGFTAGTPLAIGWNGLPQYTWEGSFDDAMLFDRALPQMEIGILMSLSSQSWPDVIQRVGPLPQQQLVESVAAGGAKRGLIQIME